MNLQGKKIAILAEQQYEDLDLQYPRLRFQEAGAQVTVIGPEARSYPSKHGYPAQADKGIREVSPGDFDGVIIPGGYSPDHMRRSPEMVEFVREMNRSGKIVAAICHAGWMLCSADIIRGRTVTGFSSIRDDLKNAGAEYVDREVVRDGNIITSRVPPDLPAFCRTIIEALEG
ncbi:MAG: type 1 glutamine amidotransferase domain-containing protein [Candidatus Competibacteraceae bacterium]|nr:type 1 glutamine amidotransferase domain-containing protein [Candidatus Competibacteraceae bacterium]